MDKKKEYRCILRKIRHKPLLMSSIYSFTKSRPNILLYVVSDDNLLKTSIKDSFSKSLIVNDLSKEINDNLDEYEKKLSIKEKLFYEYNQLKRKILSNKKLESLIQKPKKIKDKNIDDILNIFDDEEIEYFIENLADKSLIEIQKRLLEIYYESYLKTKSSWYRTNEKYFDRGEFDKVKKEDFYNNPEIYLESEKISQFFNEIIAKSKEVFKTTNLTKSLLDKMTFYEFVILNKKQLLKDYYQDLPNDEEKNIFLDKMFYLYYDKYPLEDSHSELENFLSSEFDMYPLTTKKYRQLCQEDINNEIEKNGYDLYMKNINQSTIIKILDVFFKDNYDKNEVIEFCFDYLSTFDKIYLHNFPKNINKENINNNFLNMPKDLNEINLEEINLDAKYLEYLENKKLKQKIFLICVIDRYKYSEFIDNITYPYIYELQFSLFTKSNFDDLFMFNNIPISEIYNIFITYFLTIKNYQNLEVISFGDEFFLNKNQFMDYNDKYYQSIMSYLIDQYLINSKNNNSILDNIKTIKINSNEDELSNVYEQYKILFGFNKLFPNLENKKLLELSYINDIKDIKSNNIQNNNINDIYYKIISIDFENISLNEDINTIFKNIKNFISQNMFYNVNRIKMIVFNNFNLTNLENAKIDNLSNNFNFLHNFKEFFINNNNMNISNDFIKTKLFKKFEYIYLGYDIRGNLIYYRNGKNRIKSIDILDLFNIFNKQIVRLCLKMENIDILFNSDKSILKIINLNNNNDNKYFSSLDNLSDFINNQNTISELIIEGFDFTFEQIRNNNVKKLSVNYNNNINQLFEYKINKSYKDYMLCEDLNLKNKFPLLEEISIGNMGDELILKELFKIDNFNDNLKKINLILYTDFKLTNLDDAKIEVNAIYKSKIETYNEK